jgi:hypothetical protein
LLYQLSYIGLPDYSIARCAIPAKFDGMDLQIDACNAKRPPGNRATSSFGRIVPTEAKPSELSGEIL